jgi:hypothetical protein
MLLNYWCRWLYGVRVPCWLHMCCSCLPSLPAFYTRLSWLQQ